MAEVNILPVGCSPKPPTMSDLSPVEEEKVISISESTESNIANQPYGHKILAELVGTYVIIFAGGHFNPAVTIAFAASRKFPWRQASILSSFFNCCEHRIVASCSVSICCT
ncbi:hypothetical protein CK203_041481 [Vitis vinifera]|uniref:Uncharacterized protein n=1 Tax=Vitis vinifera TaxID=29760 RepID=A0A438HNG8_VITVI|nr:hypothetical protein CK203_041481 [Vitis vinifera]